MTIPKPTQQLKIALLIFAMLGAVQSQAMVCRVTADGTNTGDGSDWNGQAMDLHTALGDADCSEIWVKGGVYKPGVAGNRGVAFVIARAVEVYGGFEGTETDLAERDPIINPTVLSGDIDDNDTVNTVGVTETAEDIVGDNSFNVVRVDGTTTAGPITGTTILDGFIITAGLADSSPDLEGGGLYCAGNGGGNECSPTLNNLTFSGNMAGSGGAMFNRGTNGGVSSPTLNNTSFIGNLSTGLGGAMYNDGIGGTSSAELNNVTFSGNSSGNDGGAMYNTGYSGGDSSPVLNNVTFSGNSSDTYGGAMYNEANEGTSSPALNNVTFSGNSANIGGAMANSAFNGISNPGLNNVILWGNDASNGPEIFNVFSVTPEINHSIVQGGCPAGSTCNNVIDADPLLGSLADNGGLTQTMLPGAGSAAIDAGNNATCMSEDQRGVSRPQGSACDIGAVEFIVATLSVEVSGQGTVSADASPEPVSGGIENCDEKGAGQAECTATYAESGNENLVLSFSPGEHRHLSTVNGCDGELAGDSFTISSLTADCTVSVTFAMDPIDGECGSAYGGAFSEPPTKDLCAAGDASLVLGDGPWFWICQGIAGGEDASCSADYQPPVDPIFQDRFE